MFIVTVKNILEKRNIAIVNTKPNEIWKRVTSWLIPELKGIDASGPGGLWVPLPSGNLFPEGSYQHRKIPKKLKVGTRQWDILRRIWQSGEEGLRYTDIQMFILGGEEQLSKGPSTLPHGQERVWDFDLGGWTNKTVRVRQSRGHYGTWLTNVMPAFCTKGTDGRWRLTHPDLVEHFEMVEKFSK